MKKIYVFFLILVILQINGFGQRRENLDKWLKIIPLLNKLKDVEEIYGKADSVSLHTAEYYKPNITIIIRYAEGKCIPNTYDYNVSEWTVIEVNYIFKENNVKIKNLRLNKRNYRLRQVGDVLHNFEYSDSKKGIAISFDNKNSQVSSIRLFPSHKTDRLYGCNRSNKANYH